MSEMKHTTGTWSTSKLSLTGAVWAGDEFIASVYPNAPEGWDGCSEFPRVNEMRANCMLIAAAPDLLSALKAMDDALCAGFETRDARMAGRKALIAARAAIAKAEGRS